MIVENLKLKPKIFISLIPNLVDMKGHQFAYHESILDKLKIPFQAYLAKHHRIDNLPPGWLPFFSKKNNLKKSPLAALRRAWEFGKLFRKKDKPRIFFLESFNTSDLCAFYLAARLFKKKQDQLVLLFRYDLKKLQILLAKRMGAVCTTDSELIARQFSNFGLQGHLLPIPHSEIFSNREKPNQEILCWWPGEPRPAKGMKEIDTLLTLEKRDDFKLLFSKDFQVKNAKIPYQQLPDPLSREAYVHWLRQTDLVLLPYNPHTYRSATSGIFVETIAAGKIPLVKEGSWLSYELKKFGLDELIADWNRPDFFSYAKKMLENPAVQSKLKKMREAYLAYHSPESFCHTLQNLLL